MADPETDATPTESEESVCREGENTLDNACASATCKWSKEMVTPDHNPTQADSALTNALALRLMWIRDLAAPPGGVPLPEEGKVQALVELTNVPDDVEAEIEVYRCGSDEAIPDSKIAALTTKDNKVIDPDTGEPPLLAFQAAHCPWDPWDKPYFYFKTKISYQSLEAQSTSDREGKPKECLRLAYWVVALAGAKDLLPDTLNECNDLVGIVTKLDHCKATSRDYDYKIVPLDQFGSELRNTYAYIQSSHGNVQHRTDGTAVDLKTMGDPPDKADPAVYRSTVSMTTVVGRFGDVQIRNTDDIVSVPRYLFYSSTCLTGWEPSFSEAMIERGCMYVLAFRRTIPNSEAPECSKKFFKLWVETYKMDPAKIPDCFDQVAPDHYDNMKPVLFSAAGERRGAPGGGLSAGEIVAIVVAAVIVGAVVVAAVACLF